MGRIGLFFKSMFSEWVSGLTGPYSIPFAVASRWASSPVQRVLCGSLAGILLLVSAYRIWAKQNDRAEKAEAGLADLSHKYFDERPQLGLEIEGPQGPTAWQTATSRDECRFWIQQLSGRTARLIRFEPIPSKGGGFTLHFDALPFLERSPHRTLLTYHVLKVGVPRLGAHDMERIGDTEAQMLGLFLNDGSPELVELRYALTARFKDNGDERTHNFSLAFDKTMFRFLTNTEEVTAA